MSWPPVQKRRRRDLGEVAESRRIRASADIIRSDWALHDGGAQDNHQPRDTQRDGPHAAPFDCAAAVRRRDGHVSTGGGFSGASQFSRHRIESRLDRALLLMQLVVGAPCSSGLVAVPQLTDVPAESRANIGTPTRNTKAPAATRAPTIATFQRRLMPAEVTHRSC